jgi:hypothetical protein
MTVAGAVAPAVAPQVAPSEVKIVSFGVGNWDLLFEGWVRGEERRGEVR